MRIIDATVIPFVRKPDQLRAYMSEPWRSRPFPSVFRYQFPAPTGEPPYGEWQQASRSSRGGLPASDPAVVRAHLDRIDAERAVLLPLTRGLLADVDMGNRVCAATNDWLAETWLGEWNDDGRFFGSIRINPRDPDGAIAELSRWAGDSRFVQVGVPLEAHAPYGQRQYAKLWEAVADSGLPVAVRADGGAGTDFYPTPNGYPQVFAEYATLYPLNHVYHVTSLIAEGVFDRIPSLRFLFTDGGHDLLMPLMWRMDMDWAISKIETPWLDRIPSDYLGEHVRFVTSRLEGPLDEALLRQWFERSDGGRLLVYGSCFPHWTGGTPEEWGVGLDRNIRHRVLSGNASEIYRFGKPVSA